MFSTHNNSHFSSGMLIGVLVGGTIGVGTLLATDKKRRRQVKKAMNRTAHMITDYVHNNVMQ